MTDFPTPEVEVVAATRLDDDTDETCDYECENDADYRILTQVGVEFVCCQRCSDYNRVYAKENDILDADYAAAKARYKDVETDGGQPLPSDYDAEDGFDSSRGVDTCRHCGVELAPQTGRHAPVFDQAGRKYGMIFDTDPMDRPFFCEECWQELDANQKASENESLERFATDGGQGQKECPYRGCGWTGREYDPESTHETIAAEVDATIHWESEHGGEIPEDAEFGDQQCPECYAVHGMNGTVSCSECGHIPEEVRADGGTDADVVVATSREDGVELVLAFRHDGSLRELATADGGRIELYRDEAAESGGDRR
ncbi:hypothetical protein D3D02_13195 [Halobellus sp. Atlit-38R]|uniref:hypothetical protein n=1 Tax=Halobellus sp. Atlit-38R TaxID=2282131 RepID=UPI000EF1F9A6|nr:hypothetical protein [Halobellus sp. Atlit-38R]RLM88161.1 hypothetical protein D3D02_13195 [Halobellus sp. Atlit-38R]